MEHRSLDDVFHVGLDEISFGKGQNYVSVLPDIGGRRVLNVVTGRDEAAATVLLKTLPASQRDEFVAAENPNAPSNAVSP